MKYVAYHRVSTKEQKAGRGINEIKKFAEEQNIKLYRDKVYVDQHTGRNFNRPAYLIIKEEVLEPGDVLIITELDRLGRSKQDTLKELWKFKEGSIRVMILEIPTTLISFNDVDNSLAKMMIETINNMMIEMYASFAQAEIEKKEKRQREGIEQMKARGEWDRYGRPAKMHQEEFNKRYEACRGRGMNPKKIMEALDLIHPTYYRYRGKYLESKSQEIAAALASKDYHLTKYDVEHIKLLLCESNCMDSGTIQEIIMESKQKKGELYE